MLILCRILHSIAFFFLPSSKHKTNVGYFAEFLLNPSSVLYKRFLQFWHVKQIHYVYLAQCHNYAQVGGYYLEFLDTDYSISEIGPIFYEYVKTRSYMVNSISQYLFNLPKYLKILLWVKDLIIKCILEAGSKLLAESIIKCWYETVYPCKSY